MKQTLFYDDIEPANDLIVKQVEGVALVEIMENDADDQEGVAHSGMILAVIKRLRAVEAQLARANADLDKVKVVKTIDTFYGKVDMKVLPTDKG